jgi:hypothetical protein
MRYFKTEVHIRVYERRRSGTYLLWRGHIKVRRVRRDKQPPTDRSLGPTQLRVMDVCTLSWHGFVVPPLPLKLPPVCPVHGPLPASPPLRPLAFVLIARRPHLSSGSQNKDNQ